MTVNERNKQKYSVSDSMVDKALYVLFENYGRQSNQKMTENYKLLYQDGVVTKNDIKMDYVHIDVNENSGYIMTYAECYYNYVLENKTPEVIDKALSCCKHYDFIKSQFEPLIALSNQDDKNKFNDKLDSVLDVMDSKHYSLEEDLIAKIVAGLYMHINGIVCSFIYNLMTILQNLGNSTCVDKVEAYYGIPAGSFQSTEDFAILKRKLVSKLERISKVTEDELLEFLYDVITTDTDCNKYFASVLVFDESGYDWNDDDRKKHIRQAYDDTIANYIITAYMIKRDEKDDEPVETQDVSRLLNSNPSKHQIIHTSFAESINEAIRMASSPARILNSGYRGRSIDRGSILYTLTSNIDSVDQFIADVILRYYVVVVTPYLKQISRNRFIQLVSGEAVASDYNTSYEEMVSKYEEMVSINRVLIHQKNALKSQLEKEQLSHSADVKEDKTDKNELELINANQKYNKLQKEYDSLKELLEKEKEKNASLNEMIQQIKERNTDENYEIDTEKKYLFILIHDVLENKLLTWFPNSRIINKSTDVGFKTIQNIDAVVAIVTSVKHPDYYGVKKLCKKHGIPFIHCNGRSYNEICKVIYECLEKDKE